MIGLVYVAVGLAIGPVRAVDVAPASHETILAII
jgi:hypothetical protein